MYTKGWGRVASTRVSFSDGFGGEQESFFFFDGSHDDLGKGGGQKYNNDACENEIY